MGAKMAAHAKRIEIAVGDRPVLERWANARAAERRLVDRARIVLLASEGRPAGVIAERLGCSLPTVKTWRARYEREGLEGLRDRRKSGRPLTHGPEVRARLIALACTRPPAVSRVSPLCIAAVDDLVLDGCADAVGGGRPTRRRSFVVGSPPVAADDRHVP